MIARLVIAGAAGWVMALSFAPTGWWWAAIPAIAALILCCLDRRPRSGLALGLVFGLVCCLSGLRWLAPVIGGDAWVGLSLYTALWSALIGAGIAKLSSTRWWWLLVPCLWVLVEAISGRVPFGGWGWLRAGFTQDTSPLLPWASIAGVPGLTFLVVLSGAALAAAIRRRDLVAPLLVVAAVWVAALAIPAPADPQDAAGPASRQVGVVQGNVPQAGLEFNAQRRAVLDNHAQQTHQLASEVAAGVMPQPDLVLWPENASDIDPFTNADAYAAIDGAVRDIAAPVLVGAVVNDPDDSTKVRNQGIVWDPRTGPGATYTKRNLVPFGEYVPFRGLLADHISRFDEIPRDFVPGNGTGALDIGGTRIGDAICFDVAYDDAMRSAVRDGARMLVVQTNNATYNGTIQPYQQFAMSRIRAVEHGRAVVVVSTSGLTGVIAPNGSLVPETAIGELQDGRYVVPIAQRDTLTVADRLGSVPEWVASVIAALALLGVRRSTSPGGSIPPSAGRVEGAAIDLQP